MLGQAPFHRQRNGIADAVIFETYLEALHARDHAGFRFGFVTHNIKDFSTPSGDNRLPHPDLAPHFTKVKSLYFTSLGDALRRAHPNEVEDAVFEREWQEDTRGISEIDEALSGLVDKLWYGRHGAFANSVDEGVLQLWSRAPKSTIGSSRTPSIGTSGRHRRRQRVAVEQQYGLDKLGPWDDFEWGMISGKVFGTPLGSRLRVGHARYVKICLITVRHSSPDRFPRRVGAHARSGSPDRESRGGNGLRVLSAR